MISFLKAVSRISNEHKTKEANKGPPKLVSKIKVQHSNLEQTSLSQVRDKLGSFVFKSN